jgi:hypothetical protein
MADDSVSGRFVFAKNARDPDLNRQNNAKINDFISTLPTTNRQGKPVRYVVCDSFIFQNEIEEIHNNDISIKDDKKIRSIDETPSLETEDITSIDDNDEAHPGTMEDTIIINDNNETDPLVAEDLINTPDNVQTPETDLRNYHPHQTRGHTTKEAIDKAISTSLLARCSDRLLVRKANNNNQHLHAWNGLGVTDHHAHFDQERQHQTTPCANTHAPFDRGRQEQIVLTVTVDPKTAFDRGRKAQTTNTTTVNKRGPTQKATTWRTAMLIMTYAILTYITAIIYRFSTHDSLNAASCPPRNYPLKCPRNYPLKCQHERKLLSGLTISRELNWWKPTRNHVFPLICNSTAPTRRISSKLHT